MTGYNGDQDEDEIETEDEVEDEEVDTLIRLLNVFGRHCVNPACDSDAFEDGEEVITLTCGCLLCVPCFTTYDDFCPVCRVHAQSTDIFHAQNGYPGDGTSVDPITIL